MLLFIFFSIIDTLLLLKTKLITKKCLICVATNAIFLLAVQGKPFVAHEHLGLLLSTANKGLWSDGAN